MGIYFAGSIRGGRAHKAIYVEIIHLLKRYGHVMTEHIGDANLDGRGESLSNEEIHDRDLAWLRSAEIVVAEVTTPSLGVGYEIGKATEWGKPVLCVCRLEGRVLSAMIAGNNEITVQEYKSVADLKGIIEEFLHAHSIAIDTQS